MDKVSTVLSIVCPPFSVNAPMHTTHGNSSPVGILAFSSLIHVSYRQESRVSDDRVVITSTRLPDGRQPGTDGPARQRHRPSCTESNVARWRRRGRERESERAKKRPGLDIKSGVLRRRIGCLPRLSRTLTGGTEYSSSRTPASPQGLETPQESAHRQCGGLEAGEIGATHSIVHSGMIRMIQQAP